MRMRPEASDMRVCTFHDGTVVIWLPSAQIIDCPLCVYEKEIQHLSMENVEMRQMFEKLERRKNREQ